MDTRWSHFSNPLLNCSFRSPTSVIPAQQFDSYGAGNTFIRLTLVPNVYSFCEKYQNACRSSIFYAVNYHLKSTRTQSSLLGFISEKQNQTSSQQLFLWHEDIYFPKKPSAEYNHLWSKHGFSTYVESPSSKMVLPLWHINNWGCVKQIFNAKKQFSEFEFHKQLC